MDLRKNFHLPLDKFIAGCLIFHLAVLVTAILPFWYIRYAALLGIIDFPT